MGVPRGEGCVKNVDAGADALQGGVLAGDESYPQGGDDEHKCVDRRLFRDKLAEL